MRKTYFMLLAAALMAGSVSAEDGAWRNINHKAPAGMSAVPGWSGNITGTADGVAEIYYSAGLAYQVIPDAPAGEYTLTANAFYRSTNSPDAAALYFDGKESLNAHIFVGDSKQEVKSLFDGAEKSELITEEGYVWGLVPNNTVEAKEAFEAGKYVSSVTANHPGGDLVIGIRNTGSLNTLDEWLCFDNFKLVGPEGDVALVNGDFVEGLTKDGWDMVTIRNEEKFFDWNKFGAVFSKTNASPYNNSQTLELPAGKYRLRVNAFIQYRPSLGAVSGEYVTMKDGWELIQGTTGWDLHQAGQEHPSEYAYIYINEGEHEVGYLNDDLINDWSNNLKGKTAQTAIKCIFDVDPLEILGGRYPQNESKDMLDADGNHCWWESGSNRESAYVFVNAPEIYENVVEYELKEAGKLTFGVRKDLRGGASKLEQQYWQPTADIRIEQWVPAESGVNNVVVDAEDANAPVEYYNLNGVRVANPENGLYIVKQGTKVSKQFIK